MSSSHESLSQKDFSHLKSAIDEAAIVAITDKKGIITYVNKKFCAISQFSADELIGKTHQVINSHFHSKEFFIDMWKTIASGKTWEGEIRNRSKDGNFYWVHTTIVPFLDAVGKPEQFVAVRYDITERKLAEEKLNVYAKKLEVSNQELQEFASVAAHDLQEPLRKIQSFSDRVRLKGQSILPPEINDYLERIQNSAKRMQILINDLLTYSRVTARAKPFATISLKEIMTQVCSDLIVRIEQSKGEVTFKDLPVIEADPTQMHQLFMNLIANSLKFQQANQTPKVEISAQVIEKSPEFSFRDVCQITVTDNGIGFDPKYLDRIFVIFQRLHGRHEFEGTGIGLAVCRKIVERHHGRITAKSAPNEGATFIVTLPIYQSGGENS